MEHETLRTQFIMKNSFKAKDLQNILKISKVRYQYLARSMGIKPDVEEVDGRGGSHIYSFENLINFAVAHRASKLGLSPKSVITIVGRLQEFKKDKAPNLFNINDESDVEIHYIYLRDLPILCIISANGGDFYPAVPETVRPMLDEALKIKDQQERANFLKNQKQAILNDYLEQMEAALKGIKRSYDEFLDTKTFRGLLEKCDGSVFINFSNIKRNIVKNL